MVGLEKFNGETQRRRGAETGEAVERRLHSAMCDKVKIWRIAVDARE
jgi:hypothetical protein